MRFGQLQMKETNVRTVLDEFASTLPDLQRQSKTIRLLGLVAGPRAEALDN